MSFNVKAGDTLHICLLCGWHGPAPEHDECEGKALPAGKVLSVDDENMEVEAVLSPEARLPFWKGTCVA